MMMKTGADLIAEAKTRIRLIDLAEFEKRRTASARPTILDVREPTETNLGRIPGAMVIPRGQLETKVEAMIPRDAAVVIYCASDNRSSLAADTMRQMGYGDVVALKGGWGAWVGSGGPVEG